MLRIALLACIAGLGMTWYGHAGSKGLPERMHGTWGADMAACQDRKSDGRVHISSRQLEFFASLCRVRTVAFSRASARVTSECSSEGERFLGTLTLDLLQNGALRIRLGRDLDAEYVRCDLRLPVR